MYSNLGFGLLGFALSEHAGLSFGSLIKESILEPLHMNMTGVTLSKAMRAHLAAGHDEGGKVVPNWGPNVLAGAFALKSTGADMMRYLEANMGILKTPLYPAMQLTHEARAAGPGANRVGWGWMTLDSNGRKVIWHNGETGGYASFIGFTADGKHGVFVLTNIAQSADDLGLATLLPNAALAPVQTTIAMSPKQLDGYVGFYQFTPHFMIAVFREGDQLYAQATGQEPMPIEPSANNEFFVPSSDISFSFLPGDKGKIVGLMLHQHGNTPAKRVGAAAAARIIGKTLVPIKATTLQQYVGKYEFESGDVIEITRNGDRLSARILGQSATPIYPSAKDRFFYILVKAELEFERGKGGKINGLVLRQNGFVRHASRIIHKS